MPSVSLRIIALAVVAFAPLLIAQSSGHESAENLLQQARLLRQAGKYRAAVQECRAAQHLEPDDQAIRHELAISLFLTQDYKGTLPELQQLLKSEPKSANLNFFVGDSLLESTRIEESIPYLETALKLNPRLLPAHVALGLAYSRLGKSEKAIPHLKLGLELDRDGSLYYQLARAYQSLGQSALSKEMMDRYVQRQKLAANDQAPSHQ